MKIYNLEKNYEKFNLNIEKMEIPLGNTYGIIGPNGCGKSTLVKLISGTIKADNGNIDYGNIDDKDITMVPRKPYMMNDSIYNNLVYPLKLRKKELFKDRIDYYLKIGGFLGREDQYAPGLSGGEMQKLALIRAMIFSPKITLIDEGFSNLDIESTLLFEEEILRKQKEDKSTWIIVSHQISSISRLCDYIFFIWDGKLLIEGTKNDILHKSSLTELKKYLQTVSI